MRLASPRLWIAVFSAAAVLGMALVDARRTSPGPLTRVHGRLPELMGERDCAACHGGWFEGMTGSCLECHEPIATQLDAGAGLHGRMDADDAARCSSCHSEHHGPGFAMVNERSFALAGVPDRDAFEHSSIGFAMDGAHLALDCTECHAHADADVVPEGEHRYLGLSQRCTSCHEDPHEGQYALACVSCHGQESFDTLASRGHDRFLALLGGHAGLDCARCHAPEGPRALDVLGARGAKKAGLEARGCVDCHESPHRGGFLGRGERVAASAAEGTCAACHQDEHETFLAAGADLTVAQHARSGFRLDAPHDALECAECHAGGAFVERFPGRAPETCSACHADPHGGQFATGPFAGRECTACHDGLAFQPHAFGPSEHERASLPLSGSHLEADCEACHVLPDGDGPRIFRGTSSRCAACHADVHEGAFDGFAELAGEEHGSCAACHGTDAFGELPAHGFEHGRFTGFPVQGAHAQAACEACHRPRDAPDAEGRRFGRVEETFERFREVGSGCAACHADPHRGDFDGPDVPRRLGGRTGCARCHVESSFRTFPHGFAHGRWTGFPLQGAHLELDCSSCHAPLRRPDENGRTWGRARGASCADCHDDPHAGQFVERGRTDCRRCHRSAESFTDLSFRHDRDARFPLGDAHSALDCAACHQAAVDEDTGLEAVRYRPLKHDCVDCHGEHERMLRTNRRRGR